jgi:hypothetical protein
VKEKIYTYTIETVSSEEKDALELSLGDIKFHNPLSNFGLELYSGRIKMSEADLIVFKLKFPEIRISRTYLPKKERQIEIMKRLKLFGIEVDVIEDLVSILKNTE